MHVACSVDLLLRAELRGCFDRVLFADVRAYYRVEFLVGEEDCVFESGGYLTECFGIACERIEITPGISEHAFSKADVAEGWDEGHRVDYF